MALGEESFSIDLQVLRRALGDIAALSALPALWLNADEDGIVESLADCLLRVLELSAVRVVLDGRPAIDRRAGAPPDQLGARLKDVVSQEPDGSAGLLLPLDEDTAVSVAVGLTNNSKVLAWATRKTFPTEAERLALAMAANQAAVALQRVRAESELRAQTEALNRERDAVAALNRTLEYERNQFRNMFEQAPGFIALLRGPQHVFEFCNQAYLRLVGRDDLQGRPIREVLPEMEGQGYLELLDRTYASGEPYAATAAPVDIGGSDGSRLRRRYVDFIYQPVLDEAKNVTGLLVEGHDVTEQVRAAEHRQLLINELNHRVKNTLATVQSLVHQTLRDAGSLTEMKATLTSRLISLSRTHDVLTRENWAGAEVAEIVNQGLIAHVEPAHGRIRSAGPTLVLGPRATLALSMALHELGTNALKYGSLSNDTGIVAIRWSRDDARYAILEWCERGGPPILGPPDRKGFGARLLQAGLAVELGAAADLKFAPEGLTCSIRIPLAEQAHDFGIGALQAEYGDRAPTPH